MSKVSANPGHINRQRFAQENDSLDLQAVVTFSNNNSDVYTTVAKLPKSLLYGFDAESYIHDLPDILHVTESCLLFFTLSRASNHLIFIQLYL